MKKDALKPNDFPVQTEDEKLKTQGGSNCRFGSIKRAC